MKFPDYITPETCQKLALNEDQSAYETEDRKLVYEVRRGVPYFAEATSFGEKETQRVFGAEWQTFTDYDADNLEKMSAGLEEFFSGKNILEVGCGSGRHSRRLVDKFGAMSVEAMDLSDAVLVAKELNSGYDNIRVTNANVFDLPFEDNFYDVGFSLGVLMHTRAPQDAFNCMCRKVKRGGKVVIWVYAKTPRKYFMEFFRFFTKNAPTMVQKMTALFLSYCLWPLVLLARKGLGLSNHFVEYAKYDFYVYKTDMYDRISAPLIAFYSEEEIQGWFENVGFDEVEVTTYGDFFVRGVGRGKA